MSALDEPEGGSYVLVQVRSGAQVFHRDDELARILHRPDRNWFLVNEFGLAVGATDRTWRQLAELGPVAYVGAFVDRSQVRQSKGEPWAQPLTAEQAGAIWDVLVKHAGADDTTPDGVYSSRTDFVITQTDGYCGEYRFQGLLGFGGKFRRTGWDDRWHIDAYREDLTPERRQAVDATNAALAALKQEVA